MRRVFYNKSVGEDISKEETFMLKHKWWSEGEVAFCVEKAAIWESGEQGGGRFVPDLKEGQDGGRKGLRKGLESAAAVRTVRALRSLEAMWGHLHFFGAQCPPWALLVLWTAWSPKDPWKLLSGVRSKRSETWTNTTAPLLEDSQWLSMLHHSLWATHGPQNGFRNSVEPYPVKKKCEAHGNTHFLDSLLSFSGGRRVLTLTWKPCNFPRVLVNKICFVRVWEIL